MDSETLVWLVRSLFALSIAANAWFIKRTAQSLDETSDKLVEITASLHEHDKRLSLVELLVEQHEKELDRYGLQEIIRKRINIQRGNNEDTD